MLRGGRLQVEPRWQVDTGPLGLGLSLGEGARSAPPVLLGVTASSTGETVSHS